MRLFYEIFGMNCHSECYRRMKCFMDYYSWHWMDFLGYPEWAHLWSHCEKTAFRARDREKSISAEKWRKQYDTASRETLSYLHGWFFKKIPEHILKMGLFQIAIRSWLYIPLSSYLRIWTQYTICVWGEGWESQESAGFSGIFFLLFVSDKSWRCWFSWCIKINPDCLQKALPAPL